MQRINTVIIVILGFLNFSLMAQPLTPNGYSGLGLIPNTNTLLPGNLVVSFDPTIPGGKITSGYNTQVGFGLTEEVELVGRLATNNLKCNMFSERDCPAGTYRDFSSSMKWAPKNDWLKKNNLTVAVGVTDFGGAATYFRSYYVIGSKKFKDFDISIGQAKSHVPTSMLDGTLSSIDWHVNKWLNINAQKIGQNTSVHAQIQSPISNTKANAWLTLNHRISDTSVVEKKWVGLGVSIPIDGSVSQATKSWREEKGTAVEKKISKINPSELFEELIKHGFYNPIIGKNKEGSVTLALENTAYLWNNLDAAGVALGLIVRAYGLNDDDQEFVLTLTQRGIRQLKVIGEAKCVGLWLNLGEPCAKLSVQSMLQSEKKLNVFNSNASFIPSFGDESDTWNSAAILQLRPEIIISPIITSAIGTEYGAYEFDMGANINTLVPLWAGASLESNRIEPIGLGTRQFEQAGVFFGSRLKSNTNRNFFHQLINLAAINTQARLSVGTAYSDWNGKQIETSSQSDSGKHKFGFTGGSFANNALSNNNERSYHLLNYRYVNNDEQTAVTEFTQGKFWGGDKGFSINQRFWYGDTTLNIYFRRTRMGGGQPLVSFAGLQFAIPFTPRENKSLQYLGFRGVSQWTYSLETKVLEKDNIITGGYGEVPRIGESLITTFNRDRNSTRYYDSNLGRMRNAYLNLSIK
jgi:hypothetical protein